MPHWCGDWGWHGAREEHGGARTRRRAFLTEDASERRTLICVVMGDSNKGQHPVVASETFVDIAAAQESLLIPEECFVWRYLFSLSSGQEDDILHLSFLAGLIEMQTERVR